MATFVSLGSRPWKWLSFSYRQPHPASLPSLYLQHLADDLIQSHLHLTHLYKWASGSGSLALLWFELMTFLSVVQHLDRRAPPERIGERELKRLEYSFNRHLLQIKFLCSGAEESPPRCVWEAPSQWTVVCSRLQECTKKFTVSHVCW